MGGGQGLEGDEESQHSGHRVEGALPGEWVPPHTEPGVSLHFAPWCLSCFTPVLPLNWCPVPQLHPGQKKLLPPPTLSNSPLLKSCRLRELTLLMNQVLPPTL